MKNSNSERDKAIREFFEHHIRFYRSEADRYQKAADRTFIFIGVLVVLTIAWLSTW